MDIDLAKYERIGSQTKLLEFSQNGLSLVGCILSSNRIEGSFGLGEITSTRYDPTYIIAEGKIQRQYDTISKVFIVKSSKNKKNGKVEESEPVEDNDQVEQVGEKEVEVKKNDDESEWNLCSDSSERLEQEKIEEEKKRKIRKKRKIDLRKQLKNKLNQLKKMKS